MNLSRLILDQVFRLQEQSALLLQLLLHIFVLTDDMLVVLKLGVEFTELAFEFAKDLSLLFFKSLFGLFHIHFQAFVNSRHILNFILKLLDSGLLRFD